MTCSLLPLWRSAPASSASARARAGSRSDTARNRTAGCFAAKRARSVPMRPEPTTAMPRLERFIGLLLCHLPHRDIAPVAAHALLVHVDAEARRIGNHHMAALDA